MANIQSINEITDKADLEFEPEQKTSNATPNQLSHKSIEFKNGDLLTLGSCA